MLNLYELAVLNAVFQMGIPIKSVAVEVAVVWVQDPRFDIAVALTTFDHLRSSGYLVVDSDGVADVTKSGRAALIESTKRTRALLDRMPYL